MDETQLDDDLEKTATPVAVQAAAVCVGITGMFFMVLGLRL